MKKTKPPATIELLIARQPTATIASIDPDGYNNFKSETFTIE